LANDNLGDTPKASTLRFADGSTQIIGSRGTWTIVDGGVGQSAKVIVFTPNVVGGTSSVQTQDPDPVNYVVDDWQSNQSASTLVTASYARSTGAFVVLINNLVGTDYLNVASGVNPFLNDGVENKDSRIDRFFEVRIADNQPAGTLITLNGVTFTTNVADSNITLGQIAWTKPTTMTVGNFSALSVDARSKPLLTGSFADISLVGAATSTTTSSVEFVAMDMSYLRNAGNYSLVSPFSSSNQGSIRFSESVATNNQPFPMAAAPNTFNSMPASTSRSISWSRNSPLTLASTSMLSLMKSVRISHSTSTRTSQFNAGGKVVEDNGTVDLRPYTQWVLGSTPQEVLNSLTTQHVNPSQLLDDEGFESLIRSISQPINSIGMVDYSPVLVENGGLEIPVAVEDTTGNDSSDLFDISQIGNKGRTLRKRIR